MKHGLKFLIMEIMIVLARLTFSFRKPRIPVFVYHSIDSSGQSISLAPSLFEQQLDYLKRHKFLLIGAEEAIETIQKKQRPFKCAVLTFDDAYTTIQPWIVNLRQNNEQATIFVPSNCMGKSNLWDQGRQDIEQISIMGPNPLRYLLALGCEIGAHTQSHPKLTEQTPTKLSNELHGARSDLLAQLTVEPQTIAYPYGDFNQQVLEATQKANYKAGFTTQLGYLTEKTNLYTIPRFPTNIDHQLFRLIVHGGYGWYRKMQELIFG